MDPIINQENSETLQATEVSDPVMEDPSLALVKEIEELKAKLAEESNLRLRAHADLDNFRKRKEQELISFRKFAQEQILLELLPVLDNFDLAIQHSGTPDSSSQKVMEGVLLIQKQLKSVLDKAGVIGINAVGQPFDPNFHQSIGQEDSELGSNLVVREMQAGYTLHGRVIRPSLVIVSN
jgi:molecular chaperone GrpE